VRNGGPKAPIEFIAGAADKQAQCEFIMLRDGRVIFEGDAHAIRASTDSYIQSFLS